MSNTPCEYSQTISLVNKANINLALFGEDYEKEERIRLTNSGGGVAIIFPWKDDPVPVKTLEEVAACLDEGIEEIYRDCVELLLTPKEFFDACALKLHSVLFGSIPWTARGRIWVNQNPDGGFFVKIALTPDLKWEWRCDEKKDLFTLVNRISCVFPEFFKQYPQATNDMIFNELITVAG